MPGYYVEEDSNSSMDTYPPSPRFGGDYAVLELDDTHEFVTPAMVGEPQAVPAKEAESEFPQDEEDDWSNDGSLLSQVIDMQNRVEQRQQEEDVLLQQQQQQQQQQQPEVLSSSYTSSSPNVSSSSYASTSSTNASNMYASNAIAGNAYGSSSDCQNAATTAHLAGDLCRWGK